MKKCGENIMFSQKKKKSKGLFFIIPVLAIFFAGLGLNAFMDGGEQNEDNKPVSAAVQKEDEKTDNKIPIYEYDNNADSDNDATLGISSVDSLDEHGYYSESDLNDASSGKNIDEIDSDEKNDQKEDKNLTDIQEKDNMNEADNDSYTGFKAVSENNLLVIYEYIDGNRVSEQITDISTDILPEYDRKMLSDGINISSETEVEELLQDYEG